MSKYYRDVNGAYLGGFDGAEPPAGAIEVATAPDDAQMLFANGVWSKQISEVKAAKLAEIQRARDAAEAADVTVQGKVFSADPKIADKFEKLASRLRRGKPTSLAGIFTVDGTPVSPVTVQLLEQIEDAIAANGEAAWNNYGAKVAAVMAAQTVDAVNAVAW